MSTPWGLVTHICINARYITGFGDGACRLIAITQLTAPILTSTNWTRTHWKWRVKLMNISFPSECVDGRNYLSHSRPGYGFPWCWVQVFFIFLFTRCIHKQIFHVWMLHIAKLVKVYIILSRIVWLPHLKNTSAWRCFIRNTLKFSALISNVNKSVPLVTNINTILHPWCEFVVTLYSIGIYVNNIAVIMSTQAFHEAF